MLAPVRIEAPAEPSVSLAEAKVHLNVTEDDWDGLIEALVASATGHLEGWTGILGGRCLVTQTWRQDLGGFPCGARVRLPLAPVQSVTSITYFDAEGAQRTLDGGVYSEPLDDDFGPFVELRTGQSWPATECRSDAVSLTFVAGYGDAADVPEPLNQAIKLCVGAWFEQREEAVAGQTIGALPDSVAAKALIAPYRRLLV